MFKTDNEVNNNVLIYASVGAGKTYLLTEEAKLYLKNKENKLYIIDLYGEYKKFGQEYNGEIISLNSYSDNKVNPFYINNKGKDNLENETFSNKIQELCSLLYNNFNNTDLSYIKAWLLEKYNRSEEITFSYLMEYIHELKAQASSKENKMRLLEWEYLTMLYTDSCLDCKNNINLDSINKNLIIFDLSHIEDIRVRSILTYSILYLIKEHIISNKKLYNSRILIDNFESIDENIDDYIFNMMKRMRVNNSGFIFATNRLRDNATRRNKYFSYTAMQILMRITADLAPEIQYDMDLSNPEIKKLENLNVGEYVKFPQFKKELKKQLLCRSYLYFIQFYFVKKRRFGKKTKGFKNINLRINHEIKSPIDIVDLEENIKMLKGFSDIRLLSYKLIDIIDA